MKSYSFLDVSTAKIILSAPELDRFGDLMFTIDIRIWAAKVLIWWNNYLQSVRKAMSIFKCSWQKATSKTWAAIKSGRIFLKNFI